MTVHIPEVSVLLCVYNGEGCIRRAVESILNQTYTDFEFLIVNDGSTDGTRALLESYRDTRLVPVNQEHAGLTKALNKGLACARGTYIARIDADDTAKPERLEKQVAFFHDHSDVVLLGSNCHGVDENGKILWTTHLPTENAQIKWRLFFNNCVPHSTVMFRKKEILELGGYDAAVGCVEDYDLWLRVVERYAVANLSEPLVYYAVPSRGAVSYEYANEQKLFAQKIQENIFKKHCPDIAERYDEIQALGDFLFFNGSLEDVACGEALFQSMYTAFCRSPYAAQIPDRELKGLRSEPYRRFAWSHFAQGSREHFKRCIHEALAGAGQKWLDTPGINLCGEEQALTEAAADYFDSLQAQPQRRIRNLFFSEQHLCFAWRHYRSGDMKNFRRCLARSFKNRLSLRVLLLLLKSFTGKQVMEKLHAIRTPRISSAECKPARCRAPLKD